MDKVKFKDIAVFINGDRGKNYPSQNEILDSGEYLFINAGHIDNNGICLENMNYISKEKYDLLNSGKIQANDILYCLRGSLGKKALIKHGMNGAIASSLVIIRLDDSKAYNKFIMYALDSPNIIDQQYKANNGSSQPNLSASSVKDYEFVLPNIGKQKQIAANLDKVTHTIDLCNNILEKLDLLVKARFVEMFGEPITNSNNLSTERMEQRFNLKAGITTVADDIHDFEEGVYEIPCYGGNGIRGYVKEKSYTGNYPIIGRQGALCGNVQYATGEFHATEHAVLVTLLKNDNSVWVYHLLKLMDLYRYHTGAAQPGLAVKTLNTVEVIVADKGIQEQFAAFVEQTDKSKSAVKQVLEKAETLKKALMQEYFG